MYIYTKEQNVFGINYKLNSINTHTHTHTHTQNHNHVNIFTKEIIKK